MTPWCCSSVPAINGGLNCSCLVSADWTYHCVDALTYFVASYSAHPHKLLQPLKLSNRNLKVLIYKILMWWSFVMFASIQISLGEPNGKMALSYFPHECLIVSSLVMGTERSHALCEISHSQTLCVFLIWLKYGTSKSGIVFSLLVSVIIRPRAYIKLWVQKFENISCAIIPLHLIHCISYFSVILVAYWLKVRWILFYYGESHANQWCLWHGILKYISC